MVLKNHISVQKNEGEDAEMTEEQFLNSPLDEEEQWYEDHFDEFVPCENQEEMRRNLREAAHNTMEQIRAGREKKPVTINLDTGAVSYFKSLAAETGIAYQNLINLYLVQCARERKRPVFA